jgi:hypothetical protein
MPNLADILNMISAENNAGKTNRPHSRGGG